MRVMKLVLATANPHKVEEIKKYFEGLQGVILSAAKNPEGSELKENGSTLRDNALQKAREAAKQTGCWALADDTGLFVEALGGRPGVFSARYAGAEADAKKNVTKLLQEMKGASDPNRGAHFSSVLALVHPDGREVVVEGRLEGAIAQAPGGDQGFGYDPIFWLEDRRCTLAEISLEEKNKISHRGLALFKMKGMVEGIIRF